jgi:DNA-binding transcriptional ArsR family regulator
MESAALLRMISEGTRHSLLQELRSGERTVSELVSSLGGEQSNLSHHLAVLRDAGLVACRREGRNQRYRLADVEVARLLEQVEQLAARLDQVAYSVSLGLPAGQAFHGDG